MAGWLVVLRSNAKSPPILRGRALNGCQSFLAVSLSADLRLESAGNHCARLSSYLIRMVCRPASSVLAHSRQSVWAQ